MNSKRRPGDAQAPPDVSDNQQRGPADNRVGGDQHPPWSIEPSHSTDHSEQCARPHHAQHQPRGAGSQCEEAHRGIGGGDEYEDHGVVEAANDRLDPRGPVESVVDRAHPEHPHYCDGINSHHRPVSPARSQSNEDGSEGSRGKSAAIAWDQPRNTGWGRARGPATVRLPTLSGWSCKSN